MNTRPDDPKRGRYPVSSFGPEVMAALVRGSIERVTMTFPNVKAATYFQHRVHTLRSVMRAEKHEHAELVSRARTMKLWGARLGEFHNDPALEKQYADDVKGTRRCDIVIQPNDIQFRDVLEKAGITVKPPKVEDFIPPIAPADPEEPEPAPTVPDPYKDFKPQ